MSHGTTPAGIDAEMSEPISSDLLARYLTGEASAADREDVERWIAEDPRNAAQLRRLQSVIMPPPAGDWNSDAAWSRVSSRMDAPRVIVLDRRRRILALAAAVAVTVGAALVWRAMDRTVASPAQVVATAAGERRDLTLPDGSRIELAPGSSVEVAAGYGNPERRVVLEGEAWFDVRHDAAQPFRVYAAGTVTEDLGTTFSVRARDGAAVRVVLVSGKASFRRAGAADLIELDPGDVGLLGPADAIPVVARQVAVSYLVSWREGRLDFRDALVGDVLAELGRWYAVDFRLGDSALAARRITHTFKANDLADALEVLSLSLGVRAERAGAVVTLR